MIEATVWDDVVELAAIAARPVSRRFRRWVEFDDLKQSASEYAFKRQDKVQEYLFEEQDGTLVRRADRDTKRQGETALITFLRRHCERIARKEKAERTGYQIEDEYYYRPALVENLIKVWGSGDYDLAGQVLDQQDMGGRKTRLVSEGNNLVAMIADVDAAMKKIDDRTRMVLVERFVHDAPLHAIADMLEVSVQRVDQLADRGIRHVIEELGGGNPYGG